MSSIRLVQAIQKKIKIAVLCHLNNKRPSYFRQLSKYYLAQAIVRKSAESQLNKCFVNYYDMQSCIVKCREEDVSLFGMFFFGSSMKKKPDKCGRDLGEHIIRVVTVKELLDNFYGSSTTIPTNYDVLIVESIGNTLSESQKQGFRDSLYEILCRDKRVYVISSDNISWLEQITKLPVLDLRFYTTQDSERHEKSASNNVQKDSNKSQTPNF